MFEKILVRPESFLKYRQPIIDLIDLFLYYDEVHIIVGPDIFVGFYRALGEDLVEELIRNQRIILHPTDSLLGCNVTDDGYYGIAFVSHGWDDIHHLLYEFHNRLIVDDKIKNEQFANRFSPILEAFSYPDEIAQCIYKDLLDADYITKALDTYLELHYPAYQNQLGAKIEIELSDTSYFPGAFQVRHNLDEIMVGKNQAKKKFDIFPFLLSVSDSRISSYMAAQYGSEINTTYEDSKLIMLQLNDLITRSSSSKENLDAFQKHILCESLSVGEAFIDKKIDDKELIEVLNEAEEFRKWLKSLPDDSSLIGDYVKELTEKSITDNAWLKAGRSILYSLIGCFGPVGSLLGATFSIADSLYMDKIVSGWKPNLFVENYRDKLNS